MTLPYWELRMDQINAELGRAGSTPIALGEGAVRALANQTTGSISFDALRGKSALAYPTISEMGRSGDFVSYQDVYLRIGGSAPGISGEWVGTANMSQRYWPTVRSMSPNNDWWRFENLVNADAWWTYRFYATNGAGRASFDFAFRTYYTEAPPTG